LRLLRSVARGDLPRNDKKESVKDVIASPALCETKRGAWQSQVEEFLTDRYMSRRLFRLKKLTPQALCALDTFMRRAALSHQLRVRKRGNAVDLSSQNYSVRAISRALKVTERSVWTWLHKYEQQGVAGLLDRPRHVSLAPDQITELMRLRYPSAPKIFKKARAWSYPKLTRWLKEKWGINLSPERLGQIIRLRMRTGN